MLQLRMEIQGGDNRERHCDKIQFTGRQIVNIQEGGEEGDNSTKQILAQRRNKKVIPIIYSRHILIITNNR